MPQTTTFQVGFTMSIRGRSRGLFEINFVSATGYYSEFYRFLHPPNPNDSTKVDIPNRIRGLFQTLKKIPDLPINQRRPFSARKNPKRKRKKYVWKAELESGSRKTSGFRRILKPSETTGMLKIKVAGNVGRASVAVRRKLICSEIRLFLMFDFRRPKPYLQLIGFYTNEITGSNRTAKTGISLLLLMMFRSDPCRDAGSLVLSP